MCLHDGCNVHICIYMMVVTYIHVYMMVVTYIRICIHDGCNLVFTNKREATSLTSSGDRR